jgi:disulfide bond formation protein DsbB
MLAAFYLTLPTILLAIGLSLPEPPIPVWSVEAAALGVEPYDISMGASTYKNSCALCHGQDANGVPRLGKPLRNSAYIQSHSDQELIALIEQGRPPTDPENTTGALMPARGGQSISDRRLGNIVMYLRAIQDPSQPTASVDAWIIDSANAASLVGGTAGIGHELFIASCAACHGTSGEGLDGLGKPLDSSLFVDSKSDEELIAFIKTGRPLWDAENTTGLDMPPKGGNPAITDKQLTDIVDYVRSIHK